MAGLPGCVVFECVGVPGVLDSIIKGCERGTRIFSVGGPPEGDHLHTLTAKRKGLNIQFGGGPSMAHWDEAFEAVCSGSLDVTPMLGRTVGLDEVPERARRRARRQRAGPHHRRALSRVNVVADPNSRELRRMSEIDELRATVEMLAAQVRALEDQVEIMQLVAQYGPASTAVRVRPRRRCGPRTASSTPSPTCRWTVATTSSPWSTATATRA